MAVASLLWPSFPLDVVLSFCEPAALFAFDATCRHAHEAVNESLRARVLRMLPPSQHALLQPEQPWRELYRAMHAGAPLLCWTRAPSLDRPRFAHSTVVYKSHVVVFGGRHGPTYLNDVATLSLRSLEWLPDVTRGARPSPKRAHTAVVLGQRMYVLGGGSDVCPGSDEMHELDLELLEWRALSRPPGWSFLGHTVRPHATRRTDWRARARALSHRAPRRTRYAAFGAAGRTVRASWAEQTGRFRRLLVGRRVQGDGRAA